MQYLVMIYMAESDWDSRSDAEKERVYQGFRTLREDLQAKGQYLGGNQLQPIATATTIRIRNGKTAVTDGPFAETKEQLGGYLLIEAKDLDQATAIAARIPLADQGSIEVRPVVMR